MKLSEFGPRDWGVQIVLWGVVLAGLGWFSRLPAIEVTAAGQTEIKLVVRYSGKRLGECREMSTADLENLPPNMRTPVVCPREKSRLYAELMIDDVIHVQETVTPSGLHNDGVLSAFHRIAVDTGNARLQLRIRDDERVEGFTHVMDETIPLSPDKVLTIHFTDDGFRLTGV
jgi:hypothetical protein